MKKLHKMMKAFAVCVALALVFCMIPVGSVYATEAGTEQKVTVTIENPTSYVGVKFYQDTDKADELEELNQFQWIAPGKTETITVQTGATARIRLYVQKDGYCIPEGNSINGATLLDNDSQVNAGNCSAAFAITVTGDEKGEMKISIPEAVCLHPNRDSSVLWGYYNCGDGKHEKACTICKEKFPETLAKHTFKEMTPAEYADSFYNATNFPDESEEWIAGQKTDLTKSWCDDLGITADTKARFCTICGYGEKIADADNSGSGNNSSTDSSNSSSSSSTSSVAANRVRYIF